MGILVVYITTVQTMVSPGENRLAFLKKGLELRNIYLILISILGLSLVIWGVALLPVYEQPLNFALLLALAVAAQITSTTLVEENVTVEVSTAVSLATAALYGPVAGSVVASAALITLSILSLRKNWPGWLRAAERIGFNAGMGAVAIAVAGLVFRAVTNWLGGDNFWGLVLAWLLAAVVNDQVNLWLLIGLLHLQNGVNPLAFWLEHRWAIPINVIVMSVGGGILAIAVQQFNFLGIAIFFLPIILSAYSFRLYVNQAKRQMEHLEEVVAERTKDLEQANEELAQLSKDKDAFLAVLTHDMRTPLTSIKGYSSILRDRELKREQQVQIAKIILRSEETLLEIVNNILDIEKLQSGTPILLERTSFDLALIARTAAESIASIALEKNITLHHEEVPQPVIITADEKKIQRVLLNLLSNAIKYTPEGGTVTVQSRMKGHYGIVEITDTGYGIPEEEIPFIFDRFRRVKGHENKAVGTGLGLAIVKSLVEAHEGEISVTSQENVGSTFTVKLPL